MPVFHVDSQTTIHLGGQVMNHVVADPMIPTGASKSEFILSPVTVEVDERRASSHNHSLAAIFHVTTDLNALAVEFSAWLNWKNSVSCIAEFEEVIAVFEIELIK